MSGDRGPPRVVSLLRSLSKRFLKPTIFKAIRENDIEQIQKCMAAENFNVNAITTEDLEGKPCLQSTALHYAVQAGLASVVSQLLTAGADIHIGHHSTVGGNGSALQSTTLALAIRRGSTKIVQLLIQAGADVKDPHAEVTLKKTGKVDSTTSTSTSTPASSSSSRQLAPIAISTAANPFHLAFHTRHMPILRLLCTHGATPDPSKVDAYLLDTVSFRLQIDILELLAQHGANVNLIVPHKTARDDAAGASVLHRLVHDAHRNPEPFVSTSGSGSRGGGGAVDVDEEPAIIPAVHPVAVLCVLLELHANPNIQDSLGSTPLHAIVANSPCDPHDDGVDTMLLLAETLVAKGNADPNIQDHRGRTPLHLACRSNALFIQPLLQMGADAALPDARGKTTLHHAAEGNSVPSKFRQSASSKSIESEGDKQQQQHQQQHHHHHHSGEARASPADIRALLQHGADINARDQAGRTALDVLTVENEALRLLLEGKGKGKGGQVKGQEKRRGSSGGTGSAQPRPQANSTGEGTGESAGHDTAGGGLQGPPVLASSSDTALAAAPSRVPRPHPCHASARHASKDSIASTSTDGKDSSISEFGSGGALGARADGRADTPPLYPTGHSSGHANTTGSVSSLRSLSPSLDSTGGSLAPPQWGLSTRRRSTPAAVGSVGSAIATGGGPGGHSHAQSRRSSTVSLKSHAQSRRSSTVSLKSHTSSTHSLPTQVIQVESVVASPPSPTPE